MTVVFDPANPSPQAARWLEETIDVLGVLDPEPFSALMLADQVAALGADHELAVEVAGHLAVALRNLAVMTSRLDQVAVDVTDAEARALKCWWLRQAVWPGR